MDKLFIIGNGFDIAHGLKSDYLYFKKYVYEKAFGKDENLTGLSGKEDIADYLVDLDKYLKRYVNDFDIQEFNIDQITDFTKVSELFYQFMLQIMDDTEYWSDFEQSLGRFTEIEIDMEEFTDKEGDFNGSVMAYNAEEVGENLKLLKPVISKLFSEWIAVTYDNWKIFVKNYRKQCYQGRLSKETIILNRDSVFLNFNYTHVLEDFYGIPSENIYHIHGEIGANLVFGHNLESEDFDNPMDVATHLSPLINSLVKPVGEILNSSHSKEFFEKIKYVEEIYFIGFGLRDKDGVDAPYFRKIFEVIPAVNIYVDEFDIERRNSIQTTLSYWGAQKTERLRFINTNRDIVLC
ncbi:AbiH family protein [Streptococcus suis]|uniref:AbiH family protein n=1 Tax=Streptococcus suis TaxID=1307 RepID=UPI0003F8493A|nr:AbiH family protein [Streptococcus suis]